MRTLAALIVAFLLYLLASTYLNRGYPDGPTSRTAAVESVAVVGRHSHDPQAYTQGFFFHDDGFFESTGLYGQSSVRRTGIDGQVTRQVMLPANVFGEGLTFQHNRLIQLTWKARTGFVRHPETLEVVDIFGLPGEGWGLTHTADHLIMSDGTNILRFLDPETFHVFRELPVSENGKAIGRLNELEWVDGEIFANVYQTPYIVRIAPDSGKVLGWIDLSPLVAEMGKPPGVANGIAYDAINRRLFVTGKHWPWVYEVARVRNDRNPDTARYSITHPSPEFSRRIQSSPSNDCPLNNQSCSHSHHAASTLKSNRCTT
ncbi:MAG: glutaminyl-peptide cyclotransferase [Gammaproteobacteria bacterium]|nr:glutaminyl-peptide cyclotransferase [Gammaproteobacteria bacterium]